MYFHQFPIGGCSKSSQIRKLAIKQKIWTYLQFGRENHINKIKAYFTE